jgi:hypothetical protein
MGRKLSLPLTLDNAKKPTTDAVRKRLGGRASTEAGAGEIVSLTTEGGSTRVGVVLFARGEDVDVWTDHGVVRRARRTSTAPCREEVPKELEQVADDARIFGGLCEGQRVRYQHETGLEEGVLVEKCRFGALLRRDDGVILGVGFRRIWPLAGGCAGG